MYIGNVINPFCILMLVSLIFTVSYSIDIPINNSSSIHNLIDSFRCVCCVSVWLVCDGNFTVYSFIRMKCFACLCTRNIFYINNLTFTFQLINYVAVRYDNLIVSTLIWYLSESRINGSYLSFKVWKYLLKFLLMYFTYKYHFK